jgi:hypothetical protein
MIKLSHLARAGLAWAVVMVGAAGSARADFITQTFTHAAQTVPYTFNFAANQFNPALGTLQSITVTETSNVTGFVNVVNINTVDEAFSKATASVPVSLNGPAGLSIGVTATTPAQSGTVAANTISPPLALPGQTIAVSASTTLTSTGALAPYIGTGVNNLSFTFGAGTGTYAGSAPFGVFFGGSASADATITVTYTFAAVPEPSSVALMGIGGVLGLVAVRKARRKA